MRPSHVRSLLLGLLVLWTSLASAAPWNGLVVGISDGDTISVLKEGKPIKIRLWGIDAPEKRQAYGTQAREFTSTLAFQQRVTVYPSTTDRYGRTIGTVILPDGRNLSNVLVHAGYAWWYFLYAKNDTILQVLETEARTLRRGLWQDAAPVAPWDWRRPTKTEKGAAQ